MRRVGKRSAALYRSGRPRASHCHHARRPAGISHAISGTCASHLCFRKSSKWRRRRYSSKDGNQGRGIMITKRVILAGFAAIVLGVGAAHAGPCNTGGKDAGSGPTPGYRSNDWYWFGKNRSASADRNDEPRGRRKSHIIAGCSKTAAGPANSRTASPGRQAFGADGRSRLLNTGGWPSTQVDGLPLLFRMHPKVRRDLARLGQFDHVHRRSVAPLAARPAFQRCFKFSDWRIPRPADGIKWKAGAGLTAIAFDLEPAET